MYQVIKMYGDWEPWWFLEDWEDDITEMFEFDDFEEALHYFQKEWDIERNSLPCFQSKANLLATFWDPKDQRWCEECDEDLQQYHSILLLKDGEELPKEYHLPAFNQKNKIPEMPSSCSLNLKM
ncbi:DUF1033 family protein [Streptococcus sp. HF-1907]|uniref:DUF1033 family protein n=1 Tax=Streptococcus sp. HF-1907 TaxID=2785793 RepID=UPI00189CC8DC|nr:DUF1033 family protein [Streptococcus sp. HF-1907]MBF7094939.1 DUF1033 family protein [Streptococcus sp. HF-1907]